MGEALQAAQEYAGTLRDGIVDPTWAPWRSLQALALAGVGRSDEAIALVEDELIWARRWEAPRTLGRTLRLLGTIGGLTKTSSCSSRGGQRHRGHPRATRVRQVARRARVSAAARPQAIGGAGAVAPRLGARRDAAPSRSSARSDGALHRRWTPAAPDADRARVADPSERRVAQLAAEGQGNREIAQTLYVTPKTIEVHLTSVYRKLGISARTGLAELLFQQHRRLITHPTPAGLGYAAMPPTAFISTVRSTCPTPRP